MRKNGSIVTVIATQTQSKFSQPWNSLTLEGCQIFKVNICTIEAVSFNKIRKFACAVCSVQFVAYWILRRTKSIDQELDSSSLIKLLYYPTTLRVICCKSCIEKGDWIFPYGKNCTSGAITCPSVERNIVIPVFSGKTWHCHL